MYRRPKFLEVLLRIREEMAREADYDVDLFAEMVRSGTHPSNSKEYSLVETDDQGMSSGNSHGKAPKSRKKAEG